jgi:hypothetical protein
MQITTTSETIIVAVVTGVVSSFFASLFFAWFTNRLRPRFKICDSIARTVNADGVATYRIKFINATRCRVHDIKISLYRVSIRLTPGEDRSNNLHTASIVSLSRNHLEFMPAFSRSRSDRDAQFAARVRIMDDLSKNWNNDSTYYRLEVSGYHSLSGVRWCSFKEFANPRDCITDGDFHHGADLRIRPALP